MCLQIMEELLTAAVSDADVSVRKSVFLSLHEDGSFDVFLAQADSLSSIFIALNDEVPFYLGACVPISLAFLYLSLQFCTCINSLILKPWFILALKFI